MFNETKTLIVVCKDELVVNQLRKFVESNDDNENGAVVGTKDGTVKIVYWDEKVWLEQKKAGIIDDKVLVIGRVKGYDKLAPVIDVKYNQWGVQYGWAGKQALLLANPKVLHDKKEYNAFSDEFKKSLLPLQKKCNSNSQKAKMCIGALAGWVGLTAKFIADQRQIEQQQLLFGIAQLYLNNLEEFINL